MNVDYTKESVLSSHWPIGWSSRWEYRISRDKSEVDEMFSLVGRWYSFQDTETPLVLVQYGTAVQAYSTSRSLPSPWSRMKRCPKNWRDVVESGIVEEDLLVVWPAPKQRQRTRSKLNTDNPTASRRKLICTTRNRSGIYIREWIISIRFLTSSNHERHLSCFSFVILTWLNINKSLIDAHNHNGCLNWYSTSEFDRNRPIGSSRLSNDWFPFIWNIP